MTPGCGAEIGGRNHVTVAGTTRIEASAFQADESELGYLIGATVGEFEHHSSSFCVCAVFV